MIFLNLKGQKRNVIIQKYLIDWDYAVSGPQKKVKDFLYPHWKRDVVLEEMRIPSTLMRIDLLSLTRKWVIEVSPSQHLEYNPFLHKSLSGFRAALKSDIEKQRWVEMNGYKFIEVFEEDIDQLSRKWFKEKYNLDL
jgi:hypothetical protein